MPHPVRTLPCHPPAPRCLTSRATDLPFGQFFMGSHRTEGDCTRQRILQAALRCFAERGYAAAAIQDIARAARVSKPALYYHFKDKADLFRALVTEAHETRRRQLETALRSGGDIRTRLTAVFKTWFDSFSENRQWLQLALATMFAAPGDGPPKFDCRELCRRNFDLVCAALAEAQARGELTRALTPRELTHALFGLVNTFLAASLWFEGDRPGANLAERLAHLFLEGAGATAPPASGSRPAGVTSLDGTVSRNSRRA
ncbi:MAG: hypothetical protein KatS3mg132_039 [Limisphaera sp.]|nr:MAG: hypothetical protein KatS3mg132_039 [Limisphaera sp.]